MHINHLVGTVFCLIQVLINAKFKPKELVRSTYGTMWHTLIAVFRKAEKGQREKRAQTHTWWRLWKSTKPLLCYYCSYDGLDWRYGQLRARLYRSMVSMASLEQLLPNESAKNGAGERQIACKIKATAKFATNYHILTIIRYDNS